MTTYTISIDHNNPYHLTLEYKISINYETTSEMTSNLFIVNFLSIFVRGTCYCSNSRVKNNCYNCNENIRFLSKMFNRLKF